MNNYSNIINRYDDMIYESSPVSLHEFITNKYNAVHDELYNYALDKYIYEVINKSLTPIVLYKCCSIVFNNDNNINIDSFLKSLSLKKDIFLKEFKDITTNELQRVADIVNSNIDSLDSNHNIILSIIDKIFGINNTILTYKNIINTIVYILDDNNVKIGYMNNGYWVIKVSNELYNNFMEYFENYLPSNNKIEIYEKYNNFICKQYKRYHKIIEIKNSEYWMPSMIRIISKTPPYRKSLINLDKYWNSIYDFEPTLEDLKISKENILDSEVIDINYVNGTATLYSKTNDITYKVKFKYLNENTNISDSMIISNTFNKY